MCIYLFCFLMLKCKKARFVVTPWSLWRSFLIPFLCIYTMQQTNSLQVYDKQEHVLMKQEFNHELWMPFIFIWFWFSMHFFLLSTWSTTAYDIPFARLISSTFLIMGFYVSWINLVKIPHIKDNLYFDIVKKEILLMTLKHQEMIWFPIF